MTQAKKAIFVAVAMISILLFFATYIFMFTVAGASRSNVSESGAPMGLENLSMRARMLLERVCQVAPLIGGPCEKLCNAKDRCYSTKKLPALPAFPAE